MRGAILTFFIPSPIGSQSNPIELKIAGLELDTLDRLVLRAQNLAGKIRGFRDTDTAVRYGKPEIRVTPRRAILADMKVSAVMLGLNLRANVDGMNAGSFRQDSRTYDIVVKLDEESGRQQIEQLQFPGAPGRPVALTAVADVQDSTAPIQITRSDKQRVSKLFSQLDSDLPMGSAVEKLDRALQTEGHIPPGYTYKFIGMSEMLGEAQNALGEAGIIAIVLVILMLAAILESFRQTVLVLVTLPLGLIGMFWALGLTRTPIDIFAMMGAVMLVGIVVNNAILIMAQFNVHIQAGVPRHKAMIAACSEQFRPVVMITIAAVLGMLPMALSKGIGGELRISTGIACMGGILVSGILTMIVMAILYDLFTRRQKNEDDGKMICHE